MRDRNGWSVLHLIMGDSLAVELAALTRAALVQIQVPQPFFKCVTLDYFQKYFYQKSITNGGKRSSTRKK